MLCSNPLKMNAITGRKIARTFPTGFSIVLNPSAAMNMRIPQKNDRTRRLRGVSADFTAHIAAAFCAIELALVQRMRKAKTNVPAKFPSQINATSAMYEGFFSTM